MGRDVGGCEGSREDDDGLWVGPFAVGDQVKDDFVGLAAEDYAVDGVDELGVAVLFGGCALVFEPVDRVVFSGDVSV